MRTTSSGAPGSAPADGQAGRRADWDEPRTVRLFYFLPNDRLFRPEVVQRMKEEILHIRTWYGEQMEAHGHGYKTFRAETDDEGDPVKAVEIVLPARAGACSTSCLTRVGCGPRAPGELKIPVRRRMPDRLSPAQRSP